MADGVSGSLPPHQSQSLRGVVSPEGQLQLGRMDVPLASIMRDLHQASRLYSAVRGFFNSDRSVRAFLNPQLLESPDMGTPHSESVEALRRLLSDGDLDGRTYRWRRALDVESRAKTFSEEELEDLRGVLLEGAMVISAVCSLDTKLLSSADKLSSRVVDGLRKKLGMPAMLRERYRASLPFDEFAPHYLRFDLDKWAQRIRLDSDGSPFMGHVCKAEHAASRVLTTGVLEIVPSIRDRFMWVTATVRDRSEGHVGFQTAVSVTNVLDVLLLARGRHVLSTNFKALLSISFACVA